MHHHPGKLNLNLSVCGDCLFCGYRLSIYSYSIVDLGGLADHHFAHIWSVRATHFTSMDLSVCLKSVKTCSNLFTLLPWQLTHYLIILFSKCLKFTPQNKFKQNVVKENFESSRVFYLLNWKFQNQLIIGQTCVQVYDYLSHFREEEIG